MKDTVPYGVGVLCPDGGHLRCVRKAVRKDRTRPVSEMLLMLWRSSRREIVEGETKMTKKQTTDKINKPEFAPEELRKAAIMYDTSFAWCKNQISAWGKNQISFTPGFNEMFDEALDTLPERNRDIVQKYFRDRMTFSQIADLHGTSRSIVRHLCIWTVWKVMNLILLREGSNQNAAPQTGGGTEGGY